MSRPLKANKKGDSTQKTQAAWNVKAGGQRPSACGDKAHLNVDEDRLIKATDDRSGALHDLNGWVDLLSGKAAAVDADSAYRK